MDASPSKLLDLLTLETIEIGLYRGRQPQVELQRTFGGQVLAQALMAAYQTVEGRRLHSMNAYFLRPGSVEAPIIYQVEPLRDGRSFSQRRVTGRQGGKAIFELQCSFHVFEEGLSHQDGLPPAPPPDECLPFVDVLSDRMAALAALTGFDDLEVRYAGDSGKGRIAKSSHVAHMRIWVRLRPDIPAGEALHQAVTAYVSDLTLLSVSSIPHEAEFLGPTMQAASIDHVMWFHRPLSVNRWFLYDQISPSASNALGFSLGRMFQDGQLVATCAQEGLVRVG